MKRQTGEQPKREGLPDPGALVRLALLLTTLLVGLLLRTFRLDVIPPGVHYDEAANGLLAAGVAEGRFRPIFFTAYAGREPLLHYLVAGVMRILGPTPFSLRLTAALLGILTLAVTYWLVLVLFSGEGRRKAEWLALSSAVFLAISFWHLVFSRYGYCHISQPLLQALSLGFLWQGLREERLEFVALGGGLCGATLYTYMASRTFPLVFLPLFAAILAGEGGRRSKRLGQMLVFALGAALVFAPLGIYSLKHPTALWVRIGQLSPSEGKLTLSALARRLWQGYKEMGVLLAIRGDPLHRFNLPGMPILRWPIALLLLLGVARSIQRLVRGHSALEQGLHLTILSWPVIMALPSVLAKVGASNLRAVGMLPVLFLLPAQGLALAIEAMHWVAPRVGSGLGRCAQAALWPLALGLLLGWGGFSSFEDYFQTWGTSAALYYQTEADLRAAAEYLERTELGGFSIVMSAEHYRHPALAFLSTAYPRIKWLIGRQVMVLPASDNRPVLYLFPHSAQPEQAFLKDHFPMERLLHQEQGPDGEVALSVYLLPSGFDSAIVPQVESHATLGGSIELIGWEVTEPLVAGDEIGLTLYWRVLEVPPLGDYTIFVHLLDEWGGSWGGEDFFDYPSEQWEVGEVIINRRRIPLTGLAPPGEYHFEVGFYSPSTGERLPRLDESGQVIGSSVSLGPVRVERSSKPRRVPVKGIENPHREGFGPYLNFLGYDQEGERMRPGETLRLALYWRARVEVEADYQVELALSDGGGGVWPLWRGRPVHDTYPTYTWRAGELVKDPYRLTIPREIPSGGYQLVLSLIDAASGQRIAGPQGTSGLELGRLVVEAPLRRFSPPPLEHSLQARLGDQVEFLGYKLNQTSGTPGARFSFTLYWRARGEMEESYTVFTHLLDGQERIWGQRDSVPVSGTYPTNLWMKGEIVEDEYEFVISPDAPAGEYMLEIGMYLADTGERLRVYLEGEDGAEDNRVLIRGIWVVSNQAG